MCADIERFRSADSHCEHESVISHTTAPPDSAKSSDKLLEERIIQLVGQVSSLELRNDELQSKLRMQDDQDVQDMYQNPYSDPFATTSPTKPKGGFNSNTFLENATKNLDADMDVITPVASMGGMSSSNIDNSDLHRELTELRMQNQSLQSNLQSSECVKERLKKVLKNVQLEDKKKNRTSCVLDESSDGNQGPVVMAAIRCREARPRHLGPRGRDPLIRIGPNLRAHS